MSLNKLADFLTSPGLPGDADKALGHYQHSLEISERLLLANPESAQAARDLMVSLERMAQATGAQPREEATRRALDFHMRVLEITLKLHQGNPQSVFYGRTAAVSFFLTSLRAHAAGESKLTQQCHAGCHAVLHELITASCQLDPPMVQLYEQLNAAAGGA